MRKDKIVLLLVMILVMIVSSSIATYIFSNQYKTKRISDIKTKNISVKSDKLYSSINYQQIRELIYPVGSIYISATDDTVAKVQARFGGTWEKFAAGKGIFGVNTSETEFNTVLKTGGEKTHTLTIAEMPKHRHTIVHRQWHVSETSHNSSSGAIYAWTTTGTSQNFKTNTADLGADANDMLTTGGGSSHNNLSPYITVYIYRRTA